MQSKELHIGVAVVAAVGLVAGLFWLRRLLFPPGYARNPFVDPVVADNESDRPRSKKPWSTFHPSRIPPKVDAVVIGSGISGLTTAICLAKAGKRVLVLEQHDVAGGFCHTFTEKGFEFDTGVHYVGQLNPGSAHRGYFDALTDGQLNWLNLGEFTDRAILKEGEGTREIAIRHGFEGYAASLIQAFPEEAANVQKFMGMMVEALQSESVFRLTVAKFYPPWLVKIMCKIPYYAKKLETRYGRQSLKEVLDTITTNEALKAVIASPYGNHNCRPGKVSFMFHCSVLYHYMVSGAFFPEGGPSEIASTMCDVLRRHGGTTLVQANVLQILTDPSGKRVLGVAVGKTRFDNEEQQVVKIDCPLVISSATIATTARLLPQLKPNSAFHKQFEFAYKNPSDSYVTVHLGLAHPTGEPVELSRSNHWLLFDTDLDGGHRKLAAGTPEEALTNGWPWVEVAFGSRKYYTDDDPRSKSDRVSCQIIALCPHSWFEKWSSTHTNHRPTEYSELKEKIGAKLVDQLRQLLPVINDLKIEHMSVSTPLTQNHYMGVRSGEMYGMELNLERFLMPNFANFRPETPIKGLLLTGQDLCYHGVCGVVQNGLFTATHALGRNMFGDISQYTELQAKLR